MGLCESAEVKYQRLRHESIEKHLLEASHQQKKIQKLLLLGAAECGKSTILKQMRIIHDDGFSNDEIHSLRRIIRENIIDAMRTMLQHCNNLGIVPTDHSTEVKSRIIEAEPKVVEDVGDMMFSHELYEALRQLWTDKAIQEVYNRRTALHLSESIKYFFDNLDRIAAEKYLPSNQDVLLTRVQTMGVTETKFTAKNINFRVYDVGGQRTERRKWIHVFDNVNAIIFLCAISEYDQKVIEDNETNRLLESLDVFKQIINNPLFSIHCSMILFLNKVDLFKEKIKTNSIATAFPAYKGGKSYEAQISYIQNEFMHLKENEEKVIYPHHTCATDTKQVEVVISGVLQAIISKSLNSLGMN